MDNRSVCKEASSFHRFREGVQDVLLGPVLIFVFAYLLLLAIGLIIISILSVKTWLFPQKSPPTVNVVVYRIPANGSAPHPVRVPTTSRTVRVLPEFFPSHIPDVWPFWDVEQDSCRRDWDITQLKEPQNWEVDGLYMTIYCFDDESGMQRNHHVPQILEPPSAMYGDVFVAKLSHGQCGQHGWAQYQDIRPYFLQDLCDKKEKEV
jgi:hypothetical protein